MGIPREEYEKGMLELLYDYHSDETKKNKRNLVVTCFIIITIYFIGVTLADLKVFGLDISKGNPKNILIIALILIHYWGGLFYIYFRQDIEIHKERQHILSNHITSLEQRKLKLEKPGYADKTAAFKNELYDIKISLDIYEKQGNRLDPARKLMRFSRSFEQIFPVFMFIITSWLLWRELFSI